MSSAPREALRSEFGGGEGAFLSLLRIDRRWDWPAFEHLLGAMEATCEEMTGDAVVERWLAEGFYLCATIVPGWTGHPEFPRPTPAERYEEALRRLDRVVFRFFVEYRRANE